MLQFASCFYLPLRIKEPSCVNLLTHIILVPCRVRQVSQVSLGLRGQQGFQEGMEMRDHPDSQDPVGKQGLRYSIPTPSVYWGHTYYCYAAMIIIVLINGK